MSWGSGGRLSVRLQREFMRDLACVLWQIFEIGHIPEERRAHVLRKLASDEREAFRTIRHAVQIVAKQLDPSVSICREVRLNGVDFVARGIQYAIRSGMSKLDAFFRLMMLPIWAEHGFPVIQIGHKLAASLLVTRVSEDVLDDLQLPFPVIEIELPSDMFHTVLADTGERFELGAMTCGRVVTTLRSSYADVIADPTPREEYAMIAHSDPCSIWSVRHKLSELSERLESSDGGAIAYPEDGIAIVAPPPELTLRPLESVESDERTLTLLARLYTNVALLMTDSSNVRQIGKSHNNPSPARSARERRSVPNPIARTYQITTPVRHDFRPIVQDYIRHGGGAPSVQSVVTGHWKMQVYGAGRTLRKRIFVQPYWRGPEDAPIALRPHKLIG